MVNEGVVRFVDAGARAPKVIAYERVLGEGAEGSRQAGPRRLMVLCSFDDAPCEYELRERTGEPIDVSAMEKLVGNYEGSWVDATAHVAILRPFECAVFAEA